MSLLKVTADRQRRPETRAFAFHWVNQIRKVLRVMPFTEVVLKTAVLSADALCWLPGVLSIPE